MSSKTYLKKKNKKINRKFNSDGKKKSSGSAPTCSVDCHNFAEGACAQFVLCQHTELVLRPRLQPRHHQPGLSTRNWHRVPVVWTEVSSLWPKNNKKKKTGIRTKTWNFYTDSIVKHRCNSFHIQFCIVFSSLRNLKENTLFLSANAWIVFQHGEDYWEDVDLHWTVPHGERLFEAAVVTGFPGHISRGCRRQYMDIAGSVWTGACVD